MKKTIVTLLVLLVSATVSAEQMTIKLKSGSTVVVNYTGSVDGISVHGDTDSIVGIEHPEMAQQQQLSPALQPDTKVIAELAEVKNKTVRASKDKTSSVRFKWTEPMDDENLKNARSDSRVASWFK